MMAKFVTLHTLHFIYLHVRYLNFRSDDNSNELYLKLYNEISVSNLELDLVVQSAGLCDNLINK
jgi:hypothetical protein